MMHLATPNASPGRCDQCSGSGIHRWGPSESGIGKFADACNACRGTGRQTHADIARNHAISRRLVRLALASRL
jgi:DnaJ-class molecular chaperone